VVAHRINSSLGGLGSPIKSNTNFIVSARSFWSGLLFLFFSCLVTPGVPYWSVLPFLFIAFLVVSFSYPTVGLVFIVFTHSFSGVIRWKDQDAALLAGFGAILISLFIMSTIVRGLIQRRFKLPVYRSDWWASKLMFIVWLLFIILLIANVAGNWGGILKTVMMFREYILPLLLFPAAISALVARPQDCRSILIALFLGGVIIAGINIFHYIFELSIPRSRWVMSFDSSSGLISDYPELRVVFGLIPVPRMNHLLGLSGASAGGVYFMVIGVLGYLFAKDNQKKIWRRLLYLGSSISVVAAVMTVSLAVIVALVFAIMFLYLSLSKQKAYVSFVLGGLAVGLMVLVLLASSEGGDSLVMGLNYILEVWHGIVVPALLQFDSIFLGDGLGLKSGEALGVADFLNEKYAQTTDQWLFVAFYQLGIVGFILTCAFFALPLWMGYKISRACQRGNIGYVALGASVVIAGFLGFSHGAAPIERLFSLPLILMIAIIVASARQVLGHPYSVSKDT